MKPLSRSLLLAATLSLVEPSDAPSQQPGVRTPRIEIRHARETPAPGFVYMEFAYPAAAAQLHSVAGFYVEERTALSDEDFAAVSADYPFTPGGLTLTVRLTSEGASRMLHETTGRIGSYLATLLDSNLVSAARIASPVGGDPDIPIFMGFRLPDRVAFETAARIAARWPR